MKINKSEFRAMIKECIRELVQEGAFNAIVTESIGSSSQVYSGGRMPVSSPDIIGHNPHSSAPTPTVHNPVLMNAIQTATALVTRAKPEQTALYSQILEDTSRTTLQKMIGQDRDGRQGMVGLALPEEQTALTKDDSKILEALANLSAGGDMSRWAQVAMGGRKPE